MTATASSPPIFRSSAARKGPIGLAVEGIRDTVSRRRLIRYLIQADLKKKGSDTVLGNVWWVLDPLLQMLVYVIMVSVIFTRKQPDYPLFVFSAVLPWKWFTSSVGDAIASVTAQERLIKQLQFPKIVLPMAVSFAGIVNFGFGLIALIGLYLVLFPHRLTAYVLLVPLIAVVQLVFTIAVALAVSAANVFIRDVANLSRHVLRLWFYLSPGLYSLALLEASSLGKEHPKVIEILRLNPFAILFEAYRSVIYGTSDGGPPTMPNWPAVTGLLVVSVVLVALATILFKRLEPTFAKVV
jgi:ABC-type polysaccharide/polyol phosphate export permease